MSGFSDHFSSQSGIYAEFRPEYPRALFEWLNGLCREHDRCWDVATGNGQAAAALAEYFNSVYASDASAKQVAEAAPHPKIQYVVEAAEKTALPDRSVDLVTVAQAIHWFNHDRFYAEVERVVKPGGVVAAWGYGLHSIESEIDGIVNHFYSAIVGEFWPPERRHIESELATIPFPFEAIRAPALAIEAEYSLQQFMGYLESWSSTQRYIKARGINPLGQIEMQLKKAWGAPQVRKIRWPLYFKVGLA
jgi:ubiquinone/menaquinone biosynthesis C-methylase UbiE